MKSTAMKQMEMDKQSPHKLTTIEKRLLSWGKRELIIDGKCGVFVEGEKMLLEVVQNNVDLLQVWVTEEFRNKRIDLMKVLSRSRVQIREVSERLMDRISDVDTPPGIVGVTNEPNWEFVSKNDSFSLIVSLHSAQDPGNVGTIIRTADYFGVDEVWLSASSVDPFAPKVVRSSMGSVFKIPIFRGDSESKIVNFKESGAIIWAATLEKEDNSQQIERMKQVKAGTKRILMLGSESRGLSESEMQISAHKVTLPRFGSAESLNLAVAAGILIYDAKRME